MAMWQFKHSHEAGSSHDMEGIHMVVQFSLESTAKVFNMQSFVQPEGSPDADIIKTHHFDLLSTIWGKKERNTVLNEKSKCTQTFCLQSGEKWVWRPSKGLCVAIACVMPGTSHAESDCSEGSLKLNWKEHLIHTKKVVGLYPTGGSIILCPLNNREMPRLGTKYILRTSPTRGNPR